MKNVEHSRRLKWCCIETARVVYKFCVGQQLHTFFLFFLFFDWTTMKCAVVHEKQSKKRRIHVVTTEIMRMYAGVWKSADHRMLKRTKRVHTHSVRVQNIKVFQLHERNNWITWILAQMSVIVSGCQRDTHHNNYNSFGNCLTKCLSVCVSVCLHDMFTSGKMMESISVAAVLS